MFRRTETTGVNTRRGRHDITGGAFPRRFGHMYMRRRGSPARQGCCRWAGVLRCSGSALTSCSQDSVIACPRHFDDVTWVGAQPSFQLLRGSSALALARSLVSLGIARLFHVALDAVELVDKSPVPSPLGRSCLGLSFPDELAPRMPSNLYARRFLLPPGGAAAPLRYGWRCSEQMTGRFGGPPRSPQ